MTEQEARLTAKRALYQQMDLLISSIEIGKSNTGVDRQIQDIAEQIRILNLEEETNQHRPQGLF